MKVAVVLFNLGGPDGPDAVRPFLFNLFNDRAIIGLPQPFRWLLAQVISRRRTKVAQKIYDQIGGWSPLLQGTRTQAAALEDALGATGDFKVFIAMRYWHPMAEETAKHVRDYGPDRIILLPLYPQFSTTTTGSSLTDWRRAAKKAGLEAPTHAVCCYPTDPDFTRAVSRLSAAAIQKAVETAPPRVLFSAHGLPQKIVDAGDPYPLHITQSVKAIVEDLAQEGLDWVICYQSRVGPLQWIGPSTEDEIARAAQDGRSIVMVPISFVSEHSETLVELDIEYRDLAESLGVTAYERVPTVSDDGVFIGGLKNLVLAALNGGDSAAAPAISSGDGKRMCPQSCPTCPQGKFHV